MSKKYPNEGIDMHFVYGVRALPNGKKKERKEEVDISVSILVIKEFVAKKYVNVLV